MFTRLLNNSTALTFVTKKMDQSKYLSGAQYSDNKNIRFKTPML